MRFLVLLLVMTFILSSAQAQGQQVPQEYNPLVYERLDVVVRALSNGSVLVELTATLRNEGKVMVVPGYGRIPLTVAQQERILGLPLPSERVVNGSVKVLEAVDVDAGKKVEALVVSENGTQVIRYALWQPLRPGESSKLKLVFRIDRSVGKGVLFDELGFSLGPLSNHVREGSLRVVAPPGATITFSYPPSSEGLWDLSGLDPGRSLKITVEFSSLPLPQLPVHGYLVLWGGLILLIIALIVIRIKSHR